MSLTARGAGLSAGHPQFPFSVPRNTAALGGRTASLVWEFLFFCSAETSREVWPYISASSWLFFVVSGEVPQHPGKE